MLTINTDATVQQPNVMRNTSHSCQAFLLSLVNTIRRNSIVLHFVRPSESNVNNVELKTSCKLSLMGLFITTAVCDSLFRAFRVNEGLNYRNSSQRLDEVRHRPEPTEQS